MFLVKPVSSQTLHSNASAIFALGHGSYMARFSAANTGYYRGRFLVTGPSGWHLNNLWLLDAPGSSSTNKGGVWNLIGFHRIGNAITLHRNGSSVDTKSASSFQLGNGTYFNIMAGSGNYNVRGDLAEVLAFQSVTTTTRQKLEGYLAHKWGLTSLLPSGHPHKTTGLNSVAWSDVQSFTTETTISAPVLGAQSVANLDTTSADLEVVLTDNGNDATTITFFYGDNDGGTTPGSWDSSLTFSNALEATIRKSVTGLTSGQTYYFRTLAKNSSSTNSGEDWANSSTAFTTITSSVREDTEAVRYSDLEGWWKLDGNLNDSSGNNHPGYLSTNPAIQAIVWLDASAAGTVTHSSNAVSQWADKSGNGNHATQTTTSAKPTYSSTDKKLSFDGGDILQVTNDPFHGLQEPAVFAVLKWNALSTWGNTVAGFRGESYGWKLRQHGNSEMLCFTIRNTGGNDDPTTSGSPDLTDGTFIVSAYRTNNNRYLRVNGSELSKFADTGSIDYSTHANMSAIGGYYSSNSFQTPGGYLNGNLHEVIVMNGASTEDATTIEGYFAHKWGLTNLFQTPPSSSSAFTTDSPTGTGQSLDLSNGTFATVSTAGTEDVFDGDSNFSVSTWVKGWPRTAGEAIIGKDHFDPGAFGTLKAWLDASNPDYFTKDGGTNPPSAGENFSKWYDLSGNNHHTSIESGAPSWESSLINSNPGAKLDGSTLVLDNSAVAFDAWSELHVFAVLRIHANTNWKRVFGKTSSVSSTANTAWSYSTRRGDNNPPTYFARVRNNSNADFYRESGNSNTTSLHDSPGGLFTMSGGGGELYKPDRWNAKQHSKFDWYDW